jgi:hypothetical protein
MGNATSILLFMLTLSFGFNLAGYPSNYTWLACALGMSKALGISTCPTNSQICPATLVPQLVPALSVFGLSSTCFDFYAIFLFTCVLIIGVGTTIGLLAFPNRYLLFAPMAIFLIGFFSFPIGIFSETNGLPVEVAGFIAMFFTVAYSFAILGFLSGGPSP